MVETSIEVKVDLHPLAGPVKTLHSERFSYLQCQMTTCKQDHFLLLSKKKLLRQKIVLLSSFL